MRTVPNVSRVASNLHQTKSNYMLFKTTSEDWMPPRGSPPPSPTDDHRPPTPLPSRRSHALSVRSEVFWHLRSRFWVVLLPPWGNRHSRRL